MSHDASAGDKQKRYQNLVAKRKQCHLCGDHGLTNPSICEGGIHDNTRHIGPWTQWQDNLDAELMVVGQDWGGTEYYIEHRGLEADTNTTNKNICELLASVGLTILLPNLPQLTRPLFFTNSVLCLRAGNLTTGTVRSRCFINCSENFLRPQVELVNPKVVVTLGHMAYCSLVKSYGGKPLLRMGDAVQENVQLTERTLLVPVYHPGNNGTRSRSFEVQKEDWKRVKKALEK